MRMQIMLAVLAAGLPASASAQAAMELSRTVFIERTTGISGERTVEPARALLTGDTVILFVEWPANRNNTSATISSAVPKELVFQSSSATVQSVSVDGGRNWGWIGALRVRDNDGERLASVEDVTHLRWHVPAKRAAQGRGRITYRARVR